MMRSLRSLIVFLSILILSACSGGTTPQDAAREFWSAVVSDSGDGAARYSTLKDGTAFDGFSRDWRNFQVGLGKVVIDGDRATITTNLSRMKEGIAEQRGVITHLVKKEGLWYVDYARTGEAVKGGALGNLFGQLAQIGNELQQQFEVAAEQFGVEMERMSRDLERFAAEAEREAQLEADRYAERLQERIDQLSASIQRSLKEQQQNLSQRQRQTLENIIEELRRQRDELEEPTLQAIAESSRVIAEAQRALGEIDSQSLDPYRQQWQEWRERFEADIQRLLDELTAGSGREV